MGVWSLSRHGQTLAMGASSDAAFGNAVNTGALNGGNGIELTTAWSVFASYEHFWTPALRTSVYGSYLAVSYDNNAQLLMCNAQIGGGILAAGTTCNNNWSSWNIGTRSQWNITKDFYVGLDVMYDRLNGATYSNAATTTPILPPVGASGVNQPMASGNNSAVVTTWRVHRDIVP
jgi:hypothetical protein